MTTHRQVTALTRPLLERHSDFVPIDHFLILKPVRNLVRFILVDRTGSAARFRPEWGAVHLCEMSSMIALNWAPDLQPFESWRWDNPTLEQDFITAVEKDALPRLQALQGLEDFFAHATKREQLSVAPLERCLPTWICLNTALGQLSTARAACANLTGRPSVWWRPESRPDFERVGLILGSLLAADDRAAMARLLHDWEAYTVAKLGIDHLWEPTPFPLEAQASIGDGRPEQTAD